MAVDSNHWLNRSLANPSASPSAGRNRIAQTTQAKINSATKIMTARILCFEDSSSVKSGDGSIFQRRSCFAGSIFATFAIAASNFSLLPRFARRLDGKRPNRQLGDQLRLFSLDDLKDCGGTLQFLIPEKGGGNS